MSTPESRYYTTFEISNFKYTAISFAFGAAFAYFGYIGSAKVEKQELSLVLFCLNGL
jgi:hypothetical protein